MIILSLGSNLGNTKVNISNAIEHLKKLGTITAISNQHITKPWGFESDNLFLNIVLTMNSTLNAFEFLDKTQQIEKEMGRTIKTKNANYSNRIIDIDIICYNGEIIDSEHLTIPHPLMQHRDFVLNPLCEIASDWVHPILHLTAKELQIKGGF